MPRSTAVLLATVVTLLAAVAAVALTGAAGTAPRSVGGRLQVVAAENVYGNIASQIGGDRVRVVSLLHDPAADPHLFSPGASATLAIARAAVVIQNGAGYDPFMRPLEAAAPDSHRVVVTIATALGADGPAANPHLWYDLPRLDAIGAAIASAMTRADPGHAHDYAAGLHTFVASLEPLRRAVASIRAGHRGAPVAYTEPVPGYLLAAAGLRVRTPFAFAKAVEDGIDPTPASVAAMLGLVRRHDVRVLLYNSQAVSPVTGQIRAAAVAAGVPVVAVTETLPPGLSFQTWQLRQVRALEQALGR
ncbi:MAG TPA: zinc ABC transporter substrate-binding protein [Gaiellales bacterium]|nr:zinc ABC transporter substrate-binding protein [Gaiellales bacterium]